MVPPLSRLINTIIFVPTLIHVFTPIPALIEEVTTCPSCVHAVTTHAYVNSSGIPHTYAGTWGHPQGISIHLTIQKKGKRRCIVCECVCVLIFFFIYYACVLNNIKYGLHSFFQFYKTIVISKEINLLRTNWQPLWRHPSYTQRWWSRTSWWWYCGQGKPYNTLWIVKLLSVKLCLA